jgi:hypothetical protein
LGAGIVADKVIQGFFVGGRPRLSALVAMRQPAIQARPGVGPPVPPPTRFAPRTAPSRQPTLPVVQPQSGTDAFAVDPAQIGLVSGGGHPLPDALRGKMEAALSAEFSAIRVHVGPQPARIGAIAFTIGTDLYFAPGRYQPDTIQGQQLLGHELAHVIQQRQGRVRSPTGSGIAVVQDRALEAEADRLGACAAVFHAPIQAKAANPMPTGRPVVWGREPMLARPSSRAGSSCGCEKSSVKCGCEQSGTSRPVLPPTSPGKVGQLSSSVGPKNLKSLKSKERTEKKKDKKKKDDEEGEKNRKGAHKRGVTAIDCYSGSDCGGNWIGRLRSAHNCCTTRSGASYSDANGICYNCRVIKINE